MEIKGDRLLSLVALAPLLATAADHRQLQTFQSWTHSTTTLVLMAIAWVALMAMVFTPLGRRVTGRSPSDTLRAVVVVWAPLPSSPGDPELVVHGPHGRPAVGLRHLVFVTLIGPAMSRFGRFTAELDPKERLRLQEEQTAAAQRGAALERVLDEVDEERH